MRTCKRCGLELPLESFNTDRRQVDGYQKWCKECHRAYKRSTRSQVIAVRRAYEAANRDTIRETRAEAYDRNPEPARARARERHTRVFGGRTDLLREKNLRLRYGLTLELYERMLAEQGGCAICRRELDGARDTVVDHDHNTGAVRGLLCRPCNTLLGMAQDRADVLESALAYLKRSVADGGTPEISR